MGRGGGKGRVLSLMTADVEREVYNSYFFSFFFDIFGLDHPLLSHPGRRRLQVNHMGYSSVRSFEKPLW